PAAPSLIGQLGFFRTGSEGGKQMIQRRVYSLVSLLTVIAVLITACGGETAPTATAVPSAPTATTAAATAPTATTAAAAAPTATTAAATAPTATTAASGSTGGQVYVGFVPPALTSPFHVAMADGATKRANELGWKLDVQAPASEGDFAAFVTT